MEFLVEFEVNVPEGTPVSEVKDRESAEGSAAAKLANEGHLVRVWNRPAAAGNTTRYSEFNAWCDPEALARAVVALLRDAARRVRLGAAAAKFTATELDEDRLVAELLDAYASVLGKRT